MSNSASDVVHGPIGYGWLVSHAIELPVSPTVLNAGLAGLVALAAALAWHAFGRLLPQ